MSKVTWKPGNMLYPLPAVLVSVADKSGHDNIFTVAWTATVCTNPPMVSISVRPERYSYQMIMDTREFVINLTTRDLAWATDYCGVTSGKNTDKFVDCHLTKENAEVVTAPLIKESPVNIECQVEEIVPLGSHTMFLAKVVCVHADDIYLNDSGSFVFEKAKPIIYSHGRYYELGREIGKFGYSIQKTNENISKINKTKINKKSKKKK